MCAFQGGLWLPSDCILRLSNANTCTAEADNKFQVRSKESALADMLTAFSATDPALHKAFNVSWGKAGVLKPLQEVIDAVFTQLNHSQGAAALFQQCDEPVQVFTSCIQEYVSTANTAIYSLWQDDSEMLAGGHSHTSEPVSCRALHAGPPCDPVQPCRYMHCYAGELSP